MQCSFSCRPESYAKADINPLTGKNLDVGISGLEPPGHAKNSDGFFEKGVLMASESMHASNGNIHEIKVIGNGHCHGMLSLIGMEEETLMRISCLEVTENCRRVQGVWLCFGGGG
jgi:hypothetical protein